MTSSLMSFVETGRLKCVALAFLLALILVSRSTCLFRILSQMSCSTLDAENVLSQYFQTFWVGCQILCALALMLSYCVYVEFTVGSNEFFVFKSKLKSLAPDK